MTDTDRTGGTDPKAVATRLRRDDALEALVAAYGPLALEPAMDPFARLLRSICRQQLSSAAAAAIERRLFAAAAPTPAAILAADPARLREAGLSERKVETVRAAARRFDTPAGMDDLRDCDDETVITELTAITGIGPWTADMVLLFGLGREDVFPVGDLAIRRATAAVTDVAVDDRAGLRARAREWRPYRSYAALYLWHHYENGATDVGTTIE